MNLKTVKGIFRYPTAIAGVLIILALAGVSIYAVLSVPYSEAIRLWRGSEEDWYKNPKTAGPVWLNWFRQEKLPETIYLTSDDEDVSAAVTEAGKSKSITYTFPVDFHYDSFPDDLTMYFSAQYSDKQPFVGLKWFAPDGREAGRCGWADQVAPDHLRRDMMIALLWGTPIALSFGLLAAIGTSLSQLIIAGVSTWFGGWVDQLIQRITEINLVLPFLPILIMIGTFYSRSIFVILTA
jgi:ABC-type dipeptide/oligopeptide/nickel transport system permease subunit